MFVSIQPEMDRTNPSGGWLSVLRWLRGNPPKSRIPTYLHEGLFDDGLSAKRCDVLVFQMDADILSHESFQNWARKSLRYDVADSADPTQRGSEIRSIIETAGDFGSLSRRDSERHVTAPAVESTETWCIASFRTRRRNPEHLTGQELCHEFMTALLESEGRPVQSFTQIDKSPSRRRRFCERHSGGFQRVEKQCRHYRALVESVVRQAISPNSGT